MQSAKVVEVSPDFSIKDLDYVDDIALLKNDKDHAQAMLCNVAATVDSVGLKISRDKTKILTNSEDVLKMAIPIDNSRLEVIDQFKYPGSLIDISGGCSTEVQIRISNYRYSMLNLGRICGDRETSY